MLLASGNKRVLTQMDVTNIPSFFLRKPDWSIMYGNDPRQAIGTRHKVYDMAAAEKMSVVLPISMRRSRKRLRFRGAAAERPFSFGHLNIAPLCSMSGTSKRI